MILPTRATRFGLRYPMTRCRCYQPPTTWREREDAVGSRPTA